MLHMNPTSIGPLISEKKMCLQSNKNYLSEMSKAMTFLDLNCRNSTAFGLASNVRKLLGYLKLFSRISKM